MTVTSGDQLLSMAEVVHKVKRNEVTKPELELGFCHPEPRGMEIIFLSAQVSNMNNSPKKVFVI